MTPIPPYFHNPAPPPADPAPTRPRPHTADICLTCYRPIRPNQPVPPPDNDPPADPAPPGIPAGFGPSTPCVGCIPIDDNRRQPAAPADPRPKNPSRVF